MAFDGIDDLSKQDSLNVDLYKAVESEDKDAFKKALKKGADINFNSGKVMEAAIWAKGSKMLRLVLEEGVMIPSTVLNDLTHDMLNNSSDLYSIHPSSKFAERYTKKVKMLLAAGADFEVYDDSNPLEHIFSGASRVRAKRDYWEGRREDNEQREERKQNERAYDKQTKCAEKIDEIAYYIKDVRDGRKPRPDKESLAAEGIELDLEKRDRNVLKLRAKAVAAAEAEYEGTVNGKGAGIGAVVQSR